MSGSVQPRGAAAVEKRLVRNSKWNLLGWLCLLVLGFVSAPIMVRELGADLYGLMALLTSFVAPLALVDLGIGEATIKYVAESLGRNDRQAVEDYLSSTFCFNLLVGVLGAGVMIVCASFLVESVFNVPTAHVPLARQCLVWLGGIWCATQIRQTFVGAVTALQEYKVVSIGTFLTQAAHTGTGLAVLLGGGGLLEMIRSQAIVAGLGVAGWWWLAGRRLPGIRLRPRFQAGVFRRSFSFGVWQMLNNLFGLLVHQAQRWLLGAFLPVAAVGFYNVGNQLVSMIYAAGYRVGQVVFPAVSQMQGEGRTDEAGRLMVQVTWVLSTAVIPAYVTLAVFAHDLLSLWVGTNFATQAEVPLRIMCVGFSVGAVFAVPNFFLLGTGRSHWLTAVAVVQGCIAFGAGWLLVPRWGVSGAAAAVAAGTIPVYCGTLVIVWRRLLRGQSSWREYFAATFCPLLIALLLLASLLPLRGFAPDWHPGWLLLGVASGVCYLVCWLVIQAVNRLLPGGSERWLGLRALLHDTLSSRLPFLFPAGR